MSAFSQTSWDFSRAGTHWNELSQLSLLTLDPTISPAESSRIRRYKELWNHYEGYHWEDIPDNEKPQVTLNYCRRFVDKFTSFLFGIDDENRSGFTIKVPTELESVTLPFLNSVWDAEYNGRNRLALRIGQSAGVTGDAFIMVRFDEPDEFNDPYGEYPEGRIRILPLLAHTVFPVYNPADKDDMLSCTIKYPITRREDANMWQKASRTMFGRNLATTRTVIYSQVWTKDVWEEWEGDILINSGKNPYNIIPVVHIPNIVIETSYYGTSDLEDVIPINKEINFKTSDNSEIIDYHSAPVTVIYGAKVSNLEKGANKVWGNLPKDAKVENLKLEGNLTASVEHINSLKESMFEIAGVPFNSLGADRGISNTSGVALQIEYMPLLEKVGWKRVSFARGLRQVCRLILLLGWYHSLIEIPSKLESKGVINAKGNDIPDSNSATASSQDTNSAIRGIITDAVTIRKLFYDVDVHFPSSLPKDTLRELEQIQLEMTMKIENRRGAMKRLGRENVEQKLREINEDLEADSEEEANRMSKYLSRGVNPPKPRTQSKMVSGFTNGPIPKPDKVDTAEV